ncbi:MAG: diguanylate cyclase [Candidatus Limnocylindria bacterium]
MTAPHQRPPEPRTPSDQRIRRAWQVFLAAAIGIAGIVLLSVADDGGRPLDWILLLLLLVAGVAVRVYATGMADVERRRAGEAASFARILSGLSRSVSPDAIVSAIVEELGDVTGADHIVLVRRRPDASVLEARLVSSRPGVPDSTTLLPLDDLEAAGGEDSPARIARRLRTVYGLMHPIAAPLTAAGGAIGAIVLSRRTGPWPEATQRMLDAAASEASAALARAYSVLDAEARASTDALTGLPNRRYFDEYVSLSARRRRSGDAVGILMVDIDRFKVLNDTHGHGVGDEVLRAVAAAIVTAVREDDVPARFGGEEFVVLLRNPDPGVAIEVGERIRAAVRNLDLREHGVDGVSVSVGVAVATEPDAPIEDLIATADRAMYRAKRGGRDRVVAA